MDLCGRRGQPRVSRGPPWVAVACGLPRPQPASSSPPHLMEEAMTPHLGRVGPAPTPRAPDPARSLRPQPAASISENKTWLCSAASYLHGGLGNMWSELRFIKAAAARDTLCTRRFTGLHGFNGFCGVSVLPHPSWPLSRRQMGDKPSLAGPAQQEGMAGRGEARGWPPRPPWEGQLLGSPWGPSPSSP